MKLSCDIIRDLLPLYTDGVCSEESGKAVKEHLAECKNCSDEYEKMKNDSFRQLEILKSEKESVLEGQRKFFRRKSLTVGTVFGGILLIPVIVCLIVNLAVGAALDWFFIVLTSLFVAASLLVVPLVAEKYKFLLTVSSFTVSLMLLLMTTAIYTHGNWFFVAALPTLFGLTVVFLPIVLNCRPACEIFRRSKAVTAFAADTVMYAVMLLAIGCYIGQGGFDFLITAVRLSAPHIVYAWLVMLVIRYAPKGAFFKTGAVIALTAVEISVADFVTEYVLSGSAALPKFSPAVWNYSTLDGNIFYLVPLFGIAVFLILTAVQLIKRREKK